MVIDLHPPPKHVPYNGNRSTSPPNMYLIIVIDLHPRNMYLIMVIDLHPPNMYLIMVIDLHPQTCTL